MRGELYRVAALAMACFLLDTEVLLQVRVKVRQVFEPSLCLPGARDAGALDTTYILGRGTVQETYKLRGVSIAADADLDGSGGGFLAAVVRVGRRPSVSVQPHGGMLASAPEPGRDFRPLCQETFP